MPRGQEFAYSKGKFSCRGTNAPLTPIIMSKERKEDSYDASNIQILE